ncbi:molybdate ABC transporter substrate-binding protein [Aquisalimonas lutea]|uniref:molybdate ABC transporter substrate-binding protein n=1 Tax=Aquisalimonas lutea TaxID=1327750 RepID=UPI0025B47FF7|nr:molybdate ABC transporter substrate-binding protein [Aquisalimonas lutea]MDN3518178.1 molybdate ABC transporter substrate-binding protein [Aquisalimonas lutea]
MVYVRCLLRLAGGVALAGVLLSGAYGQEGIRVAADASLKGVMPELVAAFEGEGGETVRASFASSAYLSAEIAAGAPYTVFLAAGASGVERLVEAEVADNTGEVFAGARLVMYVRRGAPIRAGAGTAGLADALRGQRLGHVAMADPAVSEYGRRSRDILQAAGLWAEIRGHMRMADHVAHAARMVSGGPAQAALLPAPMAGGAEMGRHGRATQLPAGTHEPVALHAALLVDGDDHPAAAFRDFLRTERAQAVLERHGFLLPPL